MDRIDRVGECTYACMHCCPTPEPGECVLCRRPLPITSGRGYGRVFCPPCSALRKRQQKRAWAQRRREAA